MAMRLAAEKPYFVPENTKADILFSNMKESKNYFAVVVDEYGGTRGVITIHNLLELLVGDMDDKEDAVVVEIAPLEDDKWKILGIAPLEEVEEILEVDIDAEDCDTFAGYILTLLGEIPDDGSVFDLETENLLIHVELVQDHTIQSTIVSKKQIEESESDKDDE